MQQIQSIEELDSAIKLLSESSSEEVLTEGIIERLALNIQGFFTVEYNPRISQQIIDSYINDYDIASLKDYMFKLYMMSLEDEPTGIVKTLKFMLSDSNRESYYRYRSKLSQQLIYGEKAIESITRRPFNFKKYADIRLTQLGKNPTATEAMGIATEVVSGNGEISELVTCAKWAMGTYATSAVIEKVFAVLGHIVSIGGTVIGWTAKILSFILINVIFGIIGLVMTYAMG